ncbi:GntR family transcriptional regulator [Ruania alba]|uniref:DNA-binding transcriptional regulator YhcF, GntR family n=1 Tax=Ruania alba TaxID=648782 RepID=A0A1H5MLP6_9MICO|nr:GntR family transcriptional regulator [Ruania alba]SEE90070.1 DNA-binding transcriptional regulator YhcF, GntR family [Ruania alba]
MTLRISLTGQDSPADQIREQIHGLVSSGRLAAGERLPSVRQLAHDLGVAAGTVAKAYRRLEAEGILVSRIGSGTTISSAATPIPREVITHARALADASRAASLEPDDAVRVLRAVWPEDG